MAKQKLKDTKQAGNTSKLFAGNRKYACVIFAFSFAIYFNSIFNDYNLDDELVTQNHRLTSKGISSIPEIFTSPYYQDATYKYEYRPIVLTSFAIEHSLFGDNPHVSHFINVLFYSLMCVLLFYVLAKLFSSYSILFSFLVTLIFAAHPIHTEVVASIKNRDEILALLFALFSLNFALVWTASRRNIFLVLVPTFFLLSIWSKSTTLTFSLLVPLALALCTNISFLRLMAVTTLLAIPAVFYSRLYSVTQQIAFAAALFAASTIFYFLRNGVLNFEEIGTQIKLKYQSLLQHTEPEIKTNYTPDFSFLRNRLTLTATVLTAMFPTILSLFGLFTGSMVVSTFFLLVLSLIYMLVRDEIKLILITPISIIGTCAIALFHSSNTLIEAALIIFLAIHIISSIQYFRIAGIVNYLIYAVIAVVFANSYLFLVLFFFAGFINKKYFPVTILIAVFSIVSFGKNMFSLANHTSEFKLAFLALPFVYTAFFLMRKNRQVLLTKLSLLSFPSILFLYFLLAPPGKSNGTVSYITSKYYQLNTTEAADFTPVQATRPLKYIEFPIEKSDSWSVKVGTSFLVLGRYALLLLIPYPMSYYYGYAEISPVEITNLSSLLSIGFYAALGLLALFFRKRNIIVCFALLFYMISISVFSNLVMPVPGMMGDRFLLIPSLSLCILLALLFIKILKANLTEPNFGVSQVSNTMKGSVALLLIIYSGVTIARNTDWKDRVTLFSQDISSVEKSAQAHNLLGVHLLIQASKATTPTEQKTSRDKAIYHLKRALEIHPLFLNASYDLARTYDGMGLYNDAEAQYERTLEIDSSFALPCYRLGIILSSKNQFERAAFLYEKYLRSYPETKEIYANLSFAYFKQSNFEKAIAVNRLALVNTNSEYEPLVNMAKIFSFQNKADSAAFYYEKAYNYRPSEKGLLKPLIEAYTKSGNKSKADYYQSMYR
jgi:tetratricopeptide (TPR) repeat protein